MSFEEVIFDVETDGLLPEHADPPFCMSTIHSMVIRDVPTGKKVSFVNRKIFDNLDRSTITALESLGHAAPLVMDDGLEILEKADMVIGHNIIDFDLPALEMMYPDFEISGKVMDTLVMSRMCFANIKDKDFRLAATGKLEGRLIGTHGLEGWGQRLGVLKGDYKKEREQELKDIHKRDGLPPPTKEELHMYVWGTWNVSMHDYMMGDADVNAELLVMIKAKNWSAEATTLEHEIHALMVQQERNGFLFDKPKAEKLGENLQAKYAQYSAKATAEIGRWYKPVRWHGIDDEKNPLVPAQGETAKRRKWGLNTIPKRTMSFNKSNAKLNGDYTKLRASTVAGVPYTKVELKDFNPNSRQQIVDRLTHMYGWTPQDFTEKGSPRVDDEILRNLEKEIPLAATLAEIFYYKKRIGMVVDGKNGWLKLCRSDSCIHGRVNVGGTVSGRATHSSPNISQVPGVTPLEFKNKIEYDMALTRHIKAGTYVKGGWNDDKGEGKLYVRGREGLHGWDCRELFIVPPGYKLVGCDLSGVEFRCLANLTYEFDGGEMVDTVLHGDIHQKNADIAGISRSVAKRLLYALMYGAGDAKLGSIVEPLSSELRQRSIGKVLRAKLMAAMPSLNKAIMAIHREARRNSGTIAGLDGRRLYVRSKHAALNLRLQSDGALIAKAWCLLVDDGFYAEGWEHHVDAEYAFCSWSHDEIQVAVREDLAERAAQIMEDAAPLAGDRFRFKCPIEAESQIGLNWAETH